MQKRAFLLFVELCERSRAEKVFSIVRREEASITIKISDPDDILYSKDIVDVIRAIEMSLYKSDIEDIVSRSQSIVAVDETYREFYGKSSVDLLRNNKNLVILRSFSKFGSIAGARVGYLMANPDLSEKFDAIRFPMGVSYFSCKLAEMVLEDKGWINKNSEEIIREREKLKNNFKDMGFQVFDSRTNFLLVKIGKRAAEICAKLRIRKILVRDRSQKKYLEGCVRITVRSDTENQILIKAIKEILNEKQI